MTYSESAEGQRVTLERCWQELERHGSEPSLPSVYVEGGSIGDEFILECWNVHSNGATMDATHLMNWLGY